MTEEEIRHKIEIEPRTLNIEDFFAYAESLNIGVNTGFDNLAVLYARAFIRGGISYEDADDALNTIWWFMCRSEVEGFANLAYSIYEAFDAGEYSHGDGKDPLKTYTIPQLQAIFKALGEKGFIE